MNAQHSRILSHIRLELQAENLPHAAIAIPQNSGMENMQLRQVLAANLRRAMERPGMDTQMAVAKKAGIGQSHLSRLLRCEASATTDLIAALARALGIQPWELLADTEATREAALRKMLGEPAEPAPPKERATRKKDGSSSDERPPH
jgi:transcriptional regulator with XRE-family HTH domain